MSNISYVYGDILKTEAQVLLHGCNCQGVMGSGVALHIKQNYPLVYEAYKNYHENYTLELGQIIPVQINNGNYIQVYTTPLESHKLLSFRHSADML